MKISGFIKNSLLDYPSELSAVIFTQSCNMRCGFCHNSDLLAYDSPSKEYFSEEYILSYLTKASGFIDALVITGGEASMQIDLLDFMIKVKKIGLKIKLDTNGTNPYVIQRLLDENLVDYIAMDIKSPLVLTKYKKLVGNNFSSVLLDNIKKTIKIIMNSNLEYEFRTTLIEEYHDYNDINAMFLSVKGAKKYVLQTFNPKNTLVLDFKKYSPLCVDEFICSELARKNAISELVLI